jgi:lysozyme
MFRVVNPNLEFLIKKHEGFRSKVYLDTTGNQTIGYGRNLISDGITEAEALVLLQNDIDHVIKFLAAYSWFNKLTQNRQNALIDLCYNIGEGSFGQFII